MIYFCHSRANGNPDEMDSCLRRNDKQFQYCYLLPGALKGAFDALNNFVKTLEEPGAIPLLKRRRPPRYAPCFTKFGQEISSCQRLPNVVDGKEAPGWTNNLSTALDAPKCQRDVCRYHNVIFGNILDDEIIRRVELSFNDNQFYPFLIGNSHP